MKKTLTIPEWLNESASAMGLNFSQVLQEALLQPAYQLTRAHSRKRSVGSFHHHLPLYLYEKMGIKITPVQMPEGCDIIALSRSYIGSLIERIIEWMDEYYSIRLSGEVFRGMKENAARGEYQARLSVLFQRIMPQYVGFSKMYSTDRRSKAFPCDVASRPPTGRGSIL